MPEEAAALIDSQTSQDDVTHAMDTFEAAMKGVPSRAAGVPEAKPEPPPQPEAKPVKVSNVPEELQGIGSATPAPAKEAEPDFDTLMSEKPTGQIKHSHYESLKAATSKKVAALTAELEKARSEAASASKIAPSGDTAKEIESLRAKLAEREAILERRYYEDSPAFKEKYGNREAQINGQIDQAAKEYGISAEDLASIRASSGKHRAGLIDALDLDGAAKADVISLLRQRDMHEADKRAALEKSKEGLTEYTTAQKAARMEAEKKQLEEDNRVFDSVKTRVLKSVGAFHQFEDDDSFNASGLKELAGVTTRADWEKAVTERLEGATKFYNGDGVTTEQLAEAGFKAAAYDFVLAMNKGLRAALQSEREKSGKLAASTPGNGHAPQHKQGDQSKLTPEQSAHSTWDSVVAPVIRR